MLKNATLAVLFMLGLGQYTSVHAQCCDYTLIMQDTYGDGWNGGNLQVLINNVSVGVFAATGNGSSVNFTVCTGDAISLIYSSGDWEEENSYVLQDASYNTVFQNGPNPTVGNAFSGIGNCNTPALQGSHPCLAYTLETYDCYATSNANFPGSGFNPNCANYQGSDVWFKIAIPPSGSLSIETLAGSVDDTGIAAWVGNNCTSLTQVGCDDDNGNGYLSLLFLYDLVPGDTLYIQAWKWGGGGGTFEICVNALQAITLTSSNLPIVIINTQGQTIVQDNKINCTMEIKYNGPGNITYFDGPANVYNGNIGIEIRGASSSGYPQKPYGFETRTETGENLNVSILGMPEENDWVLISNYNDRSLIKNLLAYKIFAEMGNYSPRGQLCEVVINGSYQGIYLIGEKIKRDNNRVAIANLNPDEISGDDLTGGYILQQNYWNEFNSFQSNYSPIDHPTFDVHFLYEYPKPDEIAPEQKTYIAAFIDSLETALYSTNFMDPINGYRKYLDVPSFIDYFIVNEVSRNNDGFKKSVFFHKDKNSNGGKLKAGPVWDFDWAWKNIQSCEIFQNNGGIGWAHHINDCFTDNYSTGWYIRLMQDSTFANELRCRYEQLRATILDTAYMFAYMDSMGVLVSESQVRHFQKWPILGISGPAPDDGPVATSHLEELEFMKNWIWTRLQWLDANIPGNAQNCEQSGVGLPGHVLSNTMRCYPNPASEQLRLEFDLAYATGVSFKMVNALGAEIWSESIGNQAVGSHAYTVDVSNMSPGIYFLQIEIEGAVHIQKVVISR
jgi:hypothetical protein